MKAINKTFKHFGIFLALIILALVIEFGFIQRLLDKRVIVEDAIIGADYYIIQVDDKPVERVKHGLLVTRVPFALVNPGKRKIIVSKTFDGKELLVFEAEIEKGKRYRASSVNDKPALQVKK